jgi:branched-chain amino acid transport system permease protein
VSGAATTAAGRAFGIGLLRTPAAADLATLALVTVVGVVLAATVSEYRALELTSWTFYGLLALSLTLVWGIGGIFSFGQAAFFGLGGYAYGAASINLIGRTGETVSAVAIAVGIGAAAAAVLGYFIFYGNLGDVYVAIVTLATTLVLLTFFSSTASPTYHVGDALLGGYNGMTGIPPLGYRDQVPLTPGEFLAVAVISAGAIAVGVHAMLRRPFGRLVAAVRENETRTQLLGYDIRRYKLLVFALGGAIAGFAGAGYAAWGQFINPAVFNLQQAGYIVIWVLVGGRRSLLGAFVGAFLIEWIQTSLATNPTWQPIILGSILIAIVLFLPRGLVPTAAVLLRRVLPQRSAPAPPQRPAASHVLPVDVEDGGGAGTGVLDGINLKKSFGGVQALRGVTLMFRGTGVHCLIGPNGAGKSTFFDLLLGRFRPSAGKILFAGEDITRKRSDERARRGLGIKLQIGSIYPELSCSENVWIASYAALHGGADAERRAESVLAWLGLLERATESAGNLSHGEQQWLEIGMVLAAEPSVILLDEPTAGMSHEETARTAELVSALGENVCVIVVEHDMEFVRRLDVPVTVFHQGALFAQGSLAELRQDERVLDIYLGRRKHVEA